MERERDFSFPYKYPYPQQRALMECIYDTIDSSKIGVLESPTGTGKSLSIICSALTWLREEERRMIDKLRLELSSSGRSAGGEEEEDDWLQAFVSQAAAAAAGTSGADARDAVQAYDSILARILHSRESKRRNVPFGAHASNAATAATPTGKEWAAGEEEDEFVMDEYDSDSEHASAHTAGRRRAAAGSGDLAEDANENEEGLAAFRFPKIIYCSRTHSQISQFVREVKMTEFRDCRCIVLGSRKQLCINNSVKSIGIDSQMSEMCLEKQKAKATAKAKGLDALPRAEGSDSGDGGGRKRRRVSALAKTEKCEFRKGASESTLADQALSQVCDIEELALLGSSLGACPYYGSRQAVKNAQLVCLPYNMLVQKSMRESLGVNLDGNVVIIDEAHNLVEAVNGAHSSEISLRDIVNAVEGVDMYLARYNTVLGGKNLVYINLLRSSLMGWKRVLECRFGSSAGKGRAEEAVANVDIGDEVLRPNDFLFRARLDNLNFMKLKRHIETTMLVRKIGGFSAWKRQTEHAPKDPSTCNCSLAAPTDCAGALRRAVDLLSCLSNEDADGRVVLCQTKVGAEESCGAGVAARVNSSSARNSTVPGMSTDIDVLGGTSIKFVLLNASSQFRDVAESARSVILLGGTMQPFSHVTTMLFPRISAEKIRLATFGHVVSDRNVLPIICSTGKMGRKFIFKHDTKFDGSLLEDLGETLISLFQHVPGGCPCFFTSYNYMEYVLKYWKQRNNKPSSIFERLQNVKKVTVESRQASICEERWNSFCTSISSGCGAALFCVIGGKMSEGINFSDDLARSVIVIGMPYPDSRDAVLQEKLKFAEKSVPGSSSAVYESMCMKAVNQCIGRSIRHAQDYASIILLDSRYQSARVQNQFPEWIKHGMKCFAQVDENFLRRLDCFYVECSLSKV